MTRQVTIRMTDEQHQAIIDASWKARKSMNQYCLDQLMQSVEQSKTNEEDEDPKEE